MNLFDLIVNGKEYAWGFGLAAVAGVVIGLIRRYRK